MWRLWCTSTSLSDHDCKIKLQRLKRLIDHNLTMCLRLVINVASRASATGLAQIQKILYSEVCINIIITIVTPLVIFRLLLTTQCVAYSKYNIFTYTISILSYISKSNISTYCSLRKWTCSFNNTKSLRKEASIFRLPRITTSSLYWPILRWCGFFLFLCLRGARRVFCFLRRLLKVCRWGWKCNMDLLHLKSIHHYL